MEVLEDWEDWDPSKGSFVTHATAGSVAGLAEHVLLTPVDTLRTHLQCQRCGGSSMWSVGRDLVQAEGFLRLFRGVSTMFIGCIPAHALYFSLFEQCKIAFGADAEGHTPLAAAASGGIATIAHDVIMVPMDTAKQRMQLGHFTGAIDAIKTTAAREGTRALFLSLPVALVHNIPYGAAMVAANETIKQVLNPSGEQNLPVFLLSGFVAGGVAATFTLPLDVVRTRLQTQDLAACLHPESPLPAVAEVCPPAAGEAVAANAPVRYTGAMHAVRVMYAREGPTAFFRGLWPRLAVHCPSVAISWGTYETVKRFVGKWVE